MTVMAVDLCEVQNCGRRAHFHVKYRWPSRPEEERKMCRDCTTEFQAIRKRQGYLVEVIPMASKGNRWAN